MTDDNRDSVATASADPNCGDPSDGDRDFLWIKVKDFPYTCQEIDTKRKIAVANGTKGFLTIPTDRVKGIECGKVLGSYDYWLYAAEKVSTYYTKHPELVGLGVNSERDRDQDQLHIHMAEFHPEVKEDLGKIKTAATDPAKWKDPSSIFPIRGRDPKSGDLVTRNYRVLWLKALDKNLFSLLDQYVAPGAENRKLQTMVSIPGLNGLWVLNSQGTLPGGNGTGTCDYLLACR